jgi:hypothetical protein
VNFPAMQDMSEFPLQKCINPYKIYYNPHNNSHFLLLQDYFLTVENWLKLKSYIRQARDVFLNNYFFVKLAFNCPVPVAHNKLPFPLSQGNF